MRRLTMLAFSTALAVAACGGDDGGGDDNGEGMLSDTPLCSAWLERDVTAEEVEFGCAQDDDALAGTAVYECDDGRTLYWNDAGWGYVGEPMTAHEDGAELVAPEAEREACPA